MQEGEASFRLRPKFNALTFITLISQSYASARLHNNNVLLKPAMGQRTSDQSENVAETEAGAGYVRKDSSAQESAEVDFSSEYKDKDADDSPALFELAPQLVQRPPFFRELEDINSILNRIVS